MNTESKIYVAGHRGLAGSAIVRRLEKDGYKNIVTRTSKELDLRDQAPTRRFFETEKPEYVFLAAAKVGGILANSTYPAEFIHDNLAIQTNVIHEAYRSGAKKLLFLGSSCIYPKHAPQPMKEDALLTGPLEPTNEWYAIAKIAGIKMCQAYRQQYGFNAICAMPTNLYGPYDNFDLHTSHVLPALMRKFHEAKVRGDREVVVWGSGTPRREFLHADDLGEAVVFLMRSPESPALVNIGTGEDLTIADLARSIAATVGYAGRIRHDTTKPDGSPQKLLNVERMRTMGWRARTSLPDGIRRTYEWYVASQPEKVVR